MPGHDLSVIQNPKLHSKGQFLHYGEWLGENRRSSFKEQLRVAIDAALSEHPPILPPFSPCWRSGIEVIHGRGGVLSFRLPGQEGATRWRGSTLGDGYGPEAVQAILEGRAPARPAPSGGAAPRRKINLVIDIQQRMAQGKARGI